VIGWGIAIGLSQLGLIFWSMLRAAWIALT
jgi:hypothetical protein